ncbi:MAG: hypothetical protein AB7O24_33650 [Kofleriaceae bacterium]
MRTARRSRTVWSKLARIAVLVASAAAVLPGSAQAALSASATAMLPGSPEAEVDAAKAAVNRTQRAADDLNQVVALFDEAVLIVAHDVELLVLRTEQCARSACARPVVQHPVVVRAANAIDRQLSRSARALARALRSSARISAERRDAVIGCIERHLSLTVQQLERLDARTANGDVDHEAERREYAATRELLTALGGRLASIATS